MAIQTGDLVVVTYEDREFTPMYRIGEILTDKAEPIDA